MREGARARPRQRTCDLVAWRSAARARDASGFDRQRVLARDGCPRRGNRREETLLLRRELGEAGERERRTAQRRYRTCPIADPVRQPRKIDGAAFCEPVRVAVRPARECRTVVGGVVAFPRPPARAARTPRMDQRPRIGGKNRRAARVDELGRLCGDDSAPRMGGLRRRAQARARGHDAGGERLLPNCLQPCIPRKRGGGGPDRASGGARLPIVERDETAREAPVGRDHGGSRVERALQGAGQEGHRWRTKDRVEGRLQSPRATDKL